MDTTNELALLEAARAGDGRALEALLARHQGRIYRFGLKMCGDPADAQDVTQETLLAMARNLGDFRGGSSLATWLYTIARSHCIKQRRRSVFAPRTHAPLDTSEAATLADPGRGPDAALADRQVGRALDQAIADLEPAAREVLVLRDVEGLSAPEVAEVLGVSVDAVKSRLHRARVAVRAALTTQLEPAADRGPAQAATCPDVLTTYSRNLEGEISADTCAELERHLEGCDRCRAACESLRRTLALCRSAAEPQVPDEIQAAVRASIRGLRTPPRAGE